MPIVPLNARPFQSTRPVWGATIQTDRRQQQREISIHAPRVGRDPDGRERDVWHSTDFNPRAPCGARHSASMTVSLSLAFQSTRPVWGATVDQRVARRG